MAEALDVLERAATDPELLADAARRAAEAVAPYRRSTVAAALDLVEAGPTRRRSAPGPASSSRRTRGPSSPRSSVTSSGAARRSASTRGCATASTSATSARGRANGRRRCCRVVRGQRGLARGTPAPGPARRGPDASHGGRARRTRTTSTSSTSTPMVFVAEHIRDAACERFRWSRSPRMHVIPNSIHLDRLDRPKLPGAEFTLGMVGFVPAFKRLDRALDSERLRAVDERFRLRCKGHMPWELPGLLKRAADRALSRPVPPHPPRAAAAGRRALRAVRLRRRRVPRRGGLDRVVERRRGPCGGLAEGMAARCAPVVLDRPGARVQYRRAVGAPRHDGRGGLGPPHAGPR